MYPSTIKEWERAKRRGKSKRSLKIDIKSNKTIKYCKNSNYIMQPTVEMLTVYPRSFKTFCILSCAILITASKSF